MLPMFCCRWNVILHTNASEAGFTVAVYDIARDPTHDVLTHEGKLLCVLVWL